MSGVVVLTPEQLEEIVSRAIDAAIARVSKTERDVLSREDVAKFLDVHEAVVLKLVRNEGLPAMKVGAQWRFMRSAVVEWLSARAVQPGAHTERQGKKMRALKETG